MLSVIITALLSQSVTTKAYIYDKQSGYQLDINADGSLNMHCVSGCGGGGGGEPASSVSVSNFPPSQPVTGTFWPATQPVSGSVSVSNFPSTQVVSVNNLPTSQQVTGTLTCQGPLTDTQLRATAVPVSGTFWPATQPVSGSVSVSNFPASFQVSNFPATQAVSGTVTVGNFPSTQTVAGSVSVSNLPATQPVSGPLTDTQLRASAVPVSGFPAVQASTLGNATGKTNVMKTGTLVTSAVTADQVALTYTVTAGKTFYLQYWSVNVRLTTFAATATFFGNCSLESPAATKLFTKVNAGSGVGDAEYLSIAEPVPFAAGTVVRWVCTPSAVTSMTWVANFGGYEK